MKIFVIVVLALIAATATANRLNLSDEQRENLRKMATECREKEGITDEQVQALRQGQFENVDVKAQCFTNCVLEKIGVMENGVVKTETMAAKLGPLIGDDKLQVVTEKCNGLTGANTCETAFNIYKCYFENHAEIQH